MKATEEAAYWWRVFSAEAAGGLVTGVERYEVILSEVEEGKADFNRLIEALAAEPAT